MGALVRWIDQRFYPGARSNWDDDLFRARILDHVAPDSDVLDLGAGAGIVPQMNFRGLARRVCGVDPDPRVLENPFLDEGRVGFGENIPYDDASFDVVFADNVLEHLDQPEAVFREVHRVLRPGGIFLAKTPNSKHYMPLIARLTPLWFHRLYNSLRGRASVDTFPTRYRANSRKALEALAQASGFQLELLETFEGRPEYMRIFGIAYGVGLAYERLVNATPALATFRILLIAGLRKTGTAPSGRLQ